MSKVTEKLGLILNNGSVAELQQALTCWREELDGNSGFQHEYFTEESKWEGAAATGVFS